MENLSNYILTFFVGGIALKIIWDWLKDRKNGRNGRKIVCPLDQKEVIGHLSVIAQTLETKDENGIPLRYHLPKWNERLENMEQSLDKICRHFTSNEDSGQ